VQAGFNQDDVRRRALASAVDADTAPAASAAASPGRRSCRDSYVMFSGGEMRFGGSRAGRARGDDDGRRTGVGSRGRGRLRASAFRRSPTRLSSSHHDLASLPPRLPLGRRGAYTISQSSTLISTALRLSSTTSARQQHPSARTSYTNMRAGLRHTRHQ
jgi:hypothetical protein